MTSSLVGSEMCIRDSYWSTPTGSQGLVVQDCDEIRQKHRTCASKETRRPVSYTHLTLPTICSV
eukprot:2238905-Prorocentrum_lima.AAC.1